MEKMKREGRGGSLLIQLNPARILLGFCRWGNIVSCVDDSDDDNESWTTKECLLRNLL